MYSRQMQQLSPLIKEIQEKYKGNPQETQVKTMELYKEYGLNPMAGCFPMLLQLVNRAINGPLDIRCDHSDLYYALNLGWIILLAREPQAVYDMNIMALRIGEHPTVRLPVICSV